MELNFIPITSLNVWRKYQLEHVGISGYDLLQKHHILLWTLSLLAISIINMTYG